MRIAAGDAPPALVAEEAFDRIMNVNLKGCLLACQAVLPTMQAQQSGSIVNISSLAAVANTPWAAYKISKAGMNALSQVLALTNGVHGIRINTIAPGLLDTPMAIGAYASVLGIDEEIVRAERNKMVPLRGKMGTAWDTAHVSLFLHSDEAGFITGVVLPVDGGQGARVG